MKSFPKSICVVLIGMLSLAIVGCESKAGNGALIGGAGGALVGGLIGSKSHARAGEGAAIGAAAGALGGALIGHGMDENDKKEARQHERETDYEARNGADWHTQVSQSDVIDWTNQGVREDVIIDRIQRSGTVFHLRASDQNYLREHGVSEAVIQTMKDSAKR